MQLHKAQVCYLSQMQVTEATYRYQDDLVMPQVYVMHNVQREVVLNSYVSLGMGNKMNMDCLLDNLGLNIEQNIGKDVDSRISSGLGG
eukprot:c36592_g1_i1 orf=73-336(+)